MSAGTSKTGLQSAAILPLFFEQHTNMPDLRPLTGPAPVVLRPFAGIHNPFPQGCSVLCNHPAENLMGADRRAFYARASQDIYFKDGARASFLSAPAPTDDWVPEELFRKYTETDSRPATPAPTLASVGGASHRRCVTPDPAARTLLVLDLRRSQSQETLSWRGMVAPAPLLTPPPPIKRQSPQQRSSPSRTRVRKAIVTPAASHPRTAEPTPTPATPGEPAGAGSEGEGGAGSPGTPRRRGLRRRRGRRNRDGAASPEKQEFKGLDEPGETQISAMGEGDASEEQPASGECVTDDGQAAVATTSGSLTSSGQDPASTWCSFLHSEILKRLQRHLCWEDVEAEFDLKRRTALEEAMKAPRFRTTTNDELMHELQQKSSDSRELWTSVPRAFSRRSARFELPLDSRRLASMRPCEYLRDHTRVSESRCALYNGIFNRHRELSSLENEPRFMRMQNVPAALAEVMGQTLTETSLHELSRLLDVDWQSSEALEFRMFCGVAAACERILGSLPSASADPPYELEVADFQTLSRRLRVITAANSSLPDLLKTLASK